MFCVKFANKASFFETEGGLASLPVGAPAQKAFQKALDSLCPNFEGCENFEGPPAAYHPNQGRIFPTSKR